MAGQPGIQRGARGDPTLAISARKRSGWKNSAPPMPRANSTNIFLDKKEAQKWLETAEARWAELSTPTDVLENPISLDRRSNSNCRMGRDLHPERFQGEGTLLQTGWSGRFREHRPSAATESADWIAHDQPHRAAAEPGVRANTPSKSHTPTRTAKTTARAR